MTKPTVTTDDPTAKPTAQIEQNQQLDSTDSKSCMCAYVCACECAHTSQHASDVSVLSDISNNIKKTKRYKPTAEPTAPTASDLYFSLADGCARPDMFAAAQSFAQLKGLPYWVYVYMAGDHRALARIEQLLLQIVQIAYQQLKPKYQAAVVAVVVQEIQHPITVRPWSGRQRAAAVEIAQRTWANNNFCEVVDALIKLIDQAFDQAHRLLNQQVLEVKSL